MGLRTCSEDVERKDTQKGVAQARACPWHAVGAVRSQVHTGSEWLRRSPEDQLSRWSSRGVQIQGRASQLSEAGVESPKPGAVCEALGLGSPLARASHVLGTRFGPVQVSCGSSKSWSLS